MITTILGILGVIAPLVVMLLDVRMRSAMKKERTDEALTHHSVDELRVGTDRVRNPKTPPTL